MIHKKGVGRMAKRVKRSRGRPKGTPRSEAELAADAMRTGRPKAENPASVPVTMRLTPDEYAKFSKDAKRIKMSMSAYLRYCWEVAREGKR